MDDRFNTIAGWTLFAGIVALGLSSVSAKFFEANKNHRPEKMGFEIEGVVSSEGGEQAVPIENLLAAADPAKGEAVFAKCKSCHGSDGKADTKEGRKSKIADMSTSEWQSKHSDAEIKKVIAEGKADTKMKAYKDKLSDAEIDGLVKYVRTLKK